ncbi:Ku protein [Paenibacillus apiarius]|uniref:non-homologous end joining protein Ku n=1 Tax=Paenibacillus apiarius TaxID=46240 RepID=UPI003B3B7999
MHTVWKGAISFGLVHVPVKMHTATEDKDISMRMIHKECGSPLSYVRSCPVCDKEVAWDEIIKGYEYEKGKFVLFEKDELEKLQEDANRAITILDFVDLKEIDPVYFQKTYYLSPDQAGSNAYQLLREALKDTAKIGIAKVTIRAKSSLAAIRVIDNCLVMETMFYPDEIRAVSQVPNVPDHVEVNPKELDMAKLLISQLSTEFEPDKYTDEYRARLLEQIQRKIAGQEVSAAPSVQPADNIVDLMAALQASIDAMKQPIGTDPGTERAPAARKPRKKAAAGAAAIAEPAPDEAAPTTRRRTSRKAAEPPAAAGGTAQPDPEPETKPATRRTRRKTAKTPADEAVQ